MENIDINRLKDIDIPRKNSEIPESSIFNDLQSIKVNSLKETIKEINLMIKEREELSKIVRNDADKAKIDINNFILEGGDNLKFTEKTLLRQKQIELEEVKIKEKIECWKDIARLKEERRKLQQEETTRETKRDILNQILE